MADWTAFDHRCKAMAGRMEGFIQKIAGHYNVEVWEDDVEDYGWSCSIPGKGKSLDVRLEIWDSGDADDGIYGVHGNLNLSVVEEGGLVVGGYIPYNYSPNVWVDYSDSKEWEKRLAIIEGLFSDVLDNIDEWRES